MSNFGFFLQECPILSKLDPSVYGSAESALTKDVIAEELIGMSFEEVSISYIVFIFSIIPITN